jgi:hypothetical protein
MKAIQIESEAAARKKWSRFLCFSFVEGDWYSYRVAVRNVGDEPVSLADCPKVEFIWTFRNQQATSGPARLPKEMKPGERVTILEKDKARVKSPGEAKLSVRLWTLPVPMTAAPAVKIKDGEGRTVPIPNAGEYFYDTEDKENYFVKAVDHEFRSFWAASQAEVKQMLLIVTAIIGLALGILYNVLRR